jgi:type I restriction enzyme S subunit
MDGLAGSEHIMRVVPNPDKIPSGYLYAFLSSNIGRAIIKTGTFGTVVDTVSPDFVSSIPVPRLEPDVEQRIHELTEQAASLRVEADQKLTQVQNRFEQEVLGISDWQWKHDNEHAYAVGVESIDPKHYRLDGFHYVGYVAEPSAILGASSLLGELIEPYQPPVFKRPYTDETGIPFLSGMDLYNEYPKPHMYISRKMRNLDRYIVPAGTILVQNVGQRYGLFGHPTILPKHLDRVAVTQHLMRVYVKNPRDRGFVYIWLSTEFGRRLLLKQSFGTSMGVLFEHSFSEMPVPASSPRLRRSFQSDVSDICERRDKANVFEDRAQKVLLKALAFDRELPGRQG